MQGNKLYVGNLTYSVTKEQIEKLFGQYGEVKDVKIIGDKGFGFVEMDSQKSAEDAKHALNGYNFEGRDMKVDEARPQQTRPNRRRF